MQPKVVAIVLRKRKKGSKMDKSHPEIVKPDSGLSWLITFFPIFSKTNKQTEKARKLRDICVLPRIEASAAPDLLTSLGQDGVSGDINKLNFISSLYFLEYSCIKQ